MINYTNWVKFTTRELIATNQWHAVAINRLITSCILTESIVNRVVLLRFIYACVYKHYINIHILTMMLGTSVFVSLLILQYKVDKLQFRSFSFAKPI